MHQSAAYKFEFANNVLACANKCKVVNDAQSCIHRREFANNETAFGNQRELTNTAAMCGNKYEFTNDYAAPNMDLQTNIFILLFINSLTMNPYTAKMCICKRYTTMPHQIWICKRFVSVLYKIDVNFQTMH